MDEEIAHAAAAGAAGPKGTGVVIKAVRKSGQETGADRGTEHTAGREGLAGLRIGPPERSGTTIDVTPRWWGGGVAITPTIATTLGHSKARICQRIDGVMDR